MKYYPFHYVVKACSYYQVIKHHYYMHFDNFIHILEDINLWKQVLVKSSLSNITSIPPPFHSWKTFWATRRIVSWHSLRNQTNIVNVFDSVSITILMAHSVRGMVLGTFKKVHFSSF